MSEETAKVDAASRFIERVEHLDNGALAQLRRAAGDRLCDRTELLWFSGVVRGKDTEAIDFLVATLLAQYKTVLIRDKKHQGNGDFGATWKRAIGPSPSESIRRRFHILLNSHLERDGGGDLPYRLRQMVRYAATHEARVDWPLLLRHLKWWSDSERWVQKEWARSFFAGGADENEDAAGDEAAETASDNASDNDDEE